MTAAGALSASQENYLEAIYHIVTEKQAAKPRDIAHFLNVGNSSVTGALRVLAGKQLIHYAPFEVITLTPRGKKIARDVVRRHRALHEFLTKVLGIGAPESDEAACRMEHAVSPAILARFTQLLAFMDDNPAGRVRWIEGRGFVQGPGGD